MAVQQWNDETLVVTLGDDPELSEDMVEVHAKLAAACCDVVLDLTVLRLLTSSGISKLLRLRKAQIECDRRLILAAPGDRVWGVLLATGLDALFEFAPTVTEAIVRLQSGLSH